MQGDLRELYQTVILDHNKRPHNFHEPEGANCRAEGHNPLCGDEVTVYLTVEDDVVRDAGFTGKGCAISKASASLMTDAVKGKSVAEVEKLFAGFRHLVTKEPVPGAESAELGKLTVFEGVREFPMRVKCAILSWHALHSALAEGGRTVTTE